MVEEPTVFVPRDDQETLLPKGRATNCLVDFFDEAFASRDTTRRMLGVAGFKLWDVVARLDVDKTRIEGRVFQIVSEFVEIENTQHADLCERGCEREVVVSVNAVLHAGLREEAEHGWVSERKSAA